MKRFNVLLIIMIMITVNLWAQEFPLREPELVKTFPFGKEDGSFGIIPVSKDVYGPTAFCFDSKGFLIIVDTNNKRICMFDNNYNFVSSINNSPIVEPNRIEIDKDDNIIGYIYKGIQKMDISGKELITIYVENNDIRDSIRSDGFYIADNLVFAYTRDNRGFIGFLNPGPDYKENNRNVLNTQEVMREIERNHPNLNIERRIDQPPALLQRSDSRRPAVPTRQKEEYVVTENGNEPLWDFDRFMKSTAQQGSSSQVKTLRSISPYSELLSKLERASKDYIGPDSDGNQYWKIAFGIFVFNPEGTPISAFEAESLSRRTTHFVVSPQGDIFYMS
ncbi:MAG: hypothetical protein KAR21_01765, partial [Spirochaetales bacterium]|nr:hypothetical protein [Spirochaetales bacterium]